MYARKYTNPSTKYTRAVAEKSAAPLQTGAPCMLPRPPRPRRYHATHVNAATRTQGEPSRERAIGRSPPVYTNRDGDLAGGTREWTGGETRA